MKEDSICVRKPLVTEVTDVIGHLIAMWMMERWQGIHLSTMCR